MRLELGWLGYRDPHYPGRPNLPNAAPVSRLGPFFLQPRWPSLIAEYTRTVADAGGAHLAEGDFDGGGGYGFAGFRRR